MSKIYWSIFLVLLSFGAFAQNTVTIKGKAIDDLSQLPLESATVYLTSVEDSTMIDYTITDKNGNFSIKARKSKQPVFLKVSFMGFKDYKQELASLENDKDFGTIRIEENASVLGEVVVKSEAPPVRIKKDTLEFNAASFKVRPDSNVESLLKQLPGVEIDANGKITVNGKEVNNILVNGKPFFGKDGKVATENLPSDIIDKVQITDTKTKEEELTGDAASSENKTINLTIQEDKNKGLFGKFGGGVGSDDRYESSGLLNWFKDKQKFSFLGSSNNINSIGFSMDEVFDSMGGGRNVYQSSDGSFNIDGQQFGGGNGITQSNMFGINYADEYLKKMEPNGSYFYTSTETNNNNKSHEEQLQTNGQKSIIDSENTTRRISNGHNLSFEMEYKIDSLTTLNIRTGLRKNNSRFTANNFMETRNADGELVNDSRGYNNNDIHNSVFENSIYFVKKFKKKGRAFSVWFENENKDDTEDLLTVSTTNKYEENIFIPRNQLQNSETVYDRYQGSITFTEPLTDSLNIASGLRYRFIKSVYDRNVYNHNAADMDYTDFVEGQSNHIFSRTNRFTPFSGLRIRKKKLYGGITLGAQFISFDNYSDQIGTRKKVNRDFVYPSLDGYLNYTLSKSKSIYVNYSYDVEMPNGNQLLDSNTVDPLNTYEGNTGLDPQTSHSFHFGYNNYDYPTRSGFYFYAGGNLHNNQVVTDEIFDASLGRRTEFKNVTGTYDSYFGFDFSKTYKKEKNVFKYTAGLNANAYLTKGFTNTNLYEAKTYSLSPRLELSYEYGDLLVVSPSYRLEFRNTDYTNFVIPSRSNNVHNFKLEVTTRWPKHLVFGNDFGYTYNSAIGEGFKKDFYLWNSSLGYNFFKDKLLAKVKVYDILNQNISSTRQITSTGFRDEQNTVLKRYVMFSLTYKIEKFGGKKKSEWGE